MAWKTFDFICTNIKCEAYHIKKEIMVKLLPVLNMLMPALNSPILLSLVTTIILLQLFIPKSAHQL